MSTIFKQSIPDITNKNVFNVTGEFLISSLNHSYDLKPKNRKHILILVLHMKIKINRTLKNNIANILTREEAFYQNE